MTGEESSCDVFDVDDIEDLIGMEFVAPNERYNNKKDVVPNIRKRKNKKQTLVIAEEDNYAKSESGGDEDEFVNIVPGIYYVILFNQ